ncbi:hypothetical protein EYY60_20965 [Flavobacterium zhairuonense]|uniref:hypothetical protein n=1 Tax=Flavobacterium zhairuonense TaxID=2493631 RepID=UPI00104B3F20|nr:hypothetical protein [Flavobacterium zhairuonense]KAF2506982.1 hypothetical protein EYY60_20965 [Flavobacterium zhairuonense]
MKEYKMNKGWAVFMYIFGTLLIAVFGFLLLMPIIPAVKNDLAPNSYWFIGPLSLVMLCVFVIAVLDTAKGKFVIDKNRIYNITTLSKRELFLHEIKGYRINDKFIIIESKSENKKDIKISTYFGKTDEIKKWLRDNNYRDLDVIEEIDEKKEILNNQEFGWNKTERKNKLNRARIFAKIMNGIGAVAGVWVLFFPNPYKYAIIPCIAFPIVSLIVLRIFKGLIRIDEKKNSAYPSIYFGFLMSTLCIFLRALIDFELLEYSNVWIPTLLIALTFASTLYFTNLKTEHTKTPDILSFLGIFALVICYTFGTFITVNCLYDHSEPEIFKTSVLDKRISTGKTTTYYLQLGPWGPRKESDEVTVSKEQYNNSKINDEAEVYLMKGQFDIPWFEVSTN